jgi:hypothetical protein
MHGPEQVLVHVPHITASEAILDTLRASRTGERARPPPCVPWSVARAVQAVVWRSTTRLLIGIFRGRSCDIFGDPAQGSPCAGRDVFRKSAAHDEISDIEYTVLQGIERGVWKRSASVAGVVITGQAAIKSKAVDAAEKAIDRALAAKRVRLVPPDDND